MITELTPEQEAQCPIYAQKWIDIGINTDRISYDRAIDIVNDVQEHLLQKPRTPIILVDDPIEAWIASNYAEKGVAVNEIMNKVAEFYATPKKDRMKLESFSTPYLVVHSTQVSGVFMIIASKFLALITKTRLKTLKFGKRLLSWA